MTNEKKQVVLEHRGLNVVVDDKQGFIGVDISTTSATLFALVRAELQATDDTGSWSWREYGFIGGYTITTPNTDEIMDKIKELVSATHKHGATRTQIGVEVFTESIRENDRTNSASRIKAITDEVVKRIKVNNEKAVYPIPVGPVPLTPYQWRSIHHLPTRVDTKSTNFKTQTFARLLGHDILKRHSVNKAVKIITTEGALVRPFDFYYIGAENQILAREAFEARLKADDNLAEAFLIAEAVSYFNYRESKFGVSEIPDTYYNTYYLKPQDIIEYANSPEAFSTTSIWI